MAKLREEAIKEKDLIEYLEKHSDFSFELSILKMLREKEIECEHGGFYEDPVSGKYREFDIRAEITTGSRTEQSSFYRIRLAVECKNIRDNFPILVSCMPRHTNESFHEYVEVCEPKGSGVYGAFASRAKAKRIREENSIYKPNAPVGKSTAQIGRTANGELTQNDGQLYDKWSQCLNSANDLVKRMYWDGHGKSYEFYYSLVFPIIIVPNGRLWTVGYDNDGKKVSGPLQVNRCSCFTGRTYSLGTEITNEQFTISHIK